MRWRRWRVAPGQLALDLDGSARREVSAAVESAVASRRVSRWDVLWALLARAASGRPTTVRALEAHLGARWQQVRSQLRRLREQGLVEPRLVEAAERRQVRRRGRPAEEWAPSSEARALAAVELLTLEAQPRPGVDLGPRQGGRRRGRAA